MSNDCRHVRLAIGAEPQTQSSEVTAHLATCAACRQFQAETRSLDGRLRAALELPLAKFRKPAPAPTRRLALAASVALGLIAVGGVWLLRPQTSLASEVVEHVLHEPGSWQRHEPVSPEALAAVLARAGVRYDVRLPVTYASPCPFRGHVVPHLVVQTDRGPLTVMVLAHEQRQSRGEFTEGKYHGVVLPMGSGSVAVVAPKGQEFDGALEAVLGGER
jgi:hypothetical protein